jgi:hypothetical protein
MHGKYELASVRQTAADVETSSKKSGRSQTTSARVGRVWKIDGSQTNENYSPKWILKRRIAFVQERIIKNDALVLR